MLSSTARSILLLQSVAPLALGIALPGGVPPPPPEDPEPPFRACAPFCQNPTYQLAEPNIYPNRNTWIVTIGRPGLYQSEANPDINKILDTYLKESLPYFLNQIVSDYKTIPDLVSTGSPLLIDAVLSIASETDVAPNAAKLKAWATSVDPKAPCDAFAAAAVSVNSVVGDTVYFDNPRKGNTTTHEQDYFLQPAYGPISHRDDIVIHYKSKFPAFWGSNPTTNIDRNVYVRSGGACYSSSSGLAAFGAQIKDLLAQFAQLKQWAEPDVDYIDTVYQIRYLKAYCEADFTFKNNPFEKAISVDSHSVDKLLPSDPIGKAFFKNWTKLNLFAKLGLPKDRTYTPAAASTTTTTTTCSQTQIYTLKFEKGSLQVKKCGACARTLIGYTTGAWVGTGCYY